MSLLEVLARVRVTSAAPFVDLLRRESVNVSSQYSGAQICRAGFLPAIRTARMETRPTMLRRYT